MNTGKRKRSRFINDKTAASDPGRLSLSHEKLRVLRPDLYGLSRIWRIFRRLILRRGWAQRDYIEEHLHSGDSRAAVVVSLYPLLVAAYTDELDCVAILSFPQEFVQAYRLSMGTRLLTVNTYKRDLPRDPDLIPGPNMIERWTGFHPIIAEFVSDDLDRINTRKRQITDNEWQRTLAMGRQYLERRPGFARDGRPVLSSIPARKRT